MELTSTLNAIQILLSETTADFQKHLNINTLCKQLRDGLFAHMEAYLASIIENVLCDPELLPELKIWPHGTSF
ncbi:hypothetical protein BuS5_00672 [Desulfosarcina sp. BuS5]|uniref:hypothetical protein n=1 Tax=Desulfosarcina sp. BuS5 TaxID=933262 RepID=UPI000484D51A|nr:hypothetical protein [Desulfosarcina sp. BuS5]WDN87704.1 hypothetical protein BuS5_00672 [Desulfosarcina sp. BuS5]